MSLPSIRRIAEVVGVSKSAVSLALRNDRSISAVTRDKIHAAAAKMGYKLNPLVAALMAQQRTGRAAENSPVIAFIDYYGAPADPGRHKGGGKLGSEATEHLQRTADLMFKAAGELGYQLDYLKARDAGMTPERLAGILAARGVRGIIFLRPRDISEPWQDMWLGHCAVELGGSGKSHHQVRLNQLATMRQLLHELSARGYRRPGLAMQGGYDYPGGFQRLAFMEYYDGKPASQRVKSFWAERWNREVFLDWWKSEKPDVVVGTDLAPLHWLREAGVDVPGETGFACSDWLPRYRTEAAGMDGRHDIRILSAVRVLDGLLRHNERGLPEVPLSTTLCGEWVDGPSVRAR